MMNKDIYRQQGVASLFGRAITKIVRPVFETNSAIWFEKDLDLDLPDITLGMPVDIDFSSMAQTIYWINARPEPWVFNMHEVVVALKNGHFFPSVKYKGEIIGYIKVGIKKVYMHDYHKVMQLPKDHAFIYDTFVLPQFRGLNIATYLIRETLLFLKEKGLKKVGCHIPSWNIPSIKAYKKLGFIEDKNIRYMRFFGICKFSERPEFPMVN